MGAAGSEAVTVSVRLSNYLMALADRAGEAFRLASGSGSIAIAGCVRSKRTDVPATG